MGASRIFDGRTKTTPFEGYEGQIVEYPLRHDAATTWASSILPAAFVSAVDFSAGHWTAPLPEGTPQEVANKFTQGVLAEPPTSEWKPFDPEHFGPEMSERMASPFGCMPSDLVVVPKASLVLFAAQMGGRPSELVAIGRRTDPRDASPAQRGCRDVDKLARDPLSRVGFASRP